MTRTRAFPDDAGFTMIEALIALAIFSIGLLALGALQANSLKSTGGIAQKNEAWTLVEDEAADLQQMPFYPATPPDPPTSYTFSADLTSGWHQDDLKNAKDWHQANALNNRYTVWWYVADNTPIAAQTNPPFSGVPSGTYTVSKLITVVATLSGGNPTTAALAKVQFVKTWAETGCNY